MQRKTNNSYPQQPLSSLYSSISPDLVVWIVHTCFYYFLIDLQDAILEEGCKIPHHSLLTFKSLQATVLQSLKEQAVIAHKTLAYESKGIKNYFLPN